MRSKRGISPIVASMLLVAMVIVIGLIIFLWFRGMTEEAITKFDGTNIKLVCEEVQFDASYSGDKVYVLNTGDVPIYKMKAMLFGDGSHTTKTLVDGWPEDGLLQGDAYSGTLPDSAEKIVLVPVLIGHSEKGNAAYTCDERNGYELTTI
ncbi:hypothetical protein B6U91_00275 [Candidatus Pacearchaeota archaeon ex4484_71]|nr:MAG: hypothetical protein B6U91_00275 [Candidatus Pacearchaeota archaeon ex4484_71]